MRHSASREFVFRRVHDMADLVEECLGEPRSPMEIDWGNQDVLGCLIGCKKTSQLHHYIHAMIAVEERREYLHGHDLYEESQDMLLEVEADLKAYGIGFQPYDDYCASRPQSPGNDWLFREWFLAHEAQFEQLWEKLTDEVFHLLFANRAFLLRFNSALSECLSLGGASIPASALAPNGRLRRQQFFPAWLRRAVFYRDQGRCVLCQRDFTGMVNPDYEMHYDHMVPLKLWGTNDPCNVQRLCADCNCTKSGAAAVTASRYVPWWDY